MTKAEMIKALEAYKDEEEIVVSNKWTTLSVEEVESIEVHCTKALHKRIVYLEDKLLGISIQVSSTMKAINDAETHLSKRETITWRKKLEKEERTLSKLHSQYLRYNTDLNTARAMTWKDYKKEYMFY